MRIAGAALIALLALLGLMTFSQDQLIFPTASVPPAGPLPANARQLLVETPDGDTLHGVHLAPEAEQAEPRTLVLGFGGNAWNAQHVAQYLAEIYPAAHVVAFHYRGYRPSTGTPSAEALLADAPLLLRSTMDRVRPDRVVVVGFSIGSGIAASLAGEPGLSGLVLVTPFDSLKAVAASLFPYFPVGFFFRHEIATANYLAGADVPVAILAAEKDEIIPPARTDALRPRIGNLKFDQTIAGAGHNDVYERPDFARAMREALAAVAGS